ncbi:hypothetical protein D3C80_1278620 [compost metagenome]
MAAGDQGYRFFVIHRHAGEGIADVAGRGERIGIAVRAFRIDIDKAHLHCTERFGKLTFAAVTLVAQPGAFRPPIKLFRLPYVCTAAGKTEGLEAHRFQRDIAGQDHQVGPRYAVAVFLLDRPQEAASLIEVDVIGPAVERCKTLLPHAGATSAIGDAIGAGAVPGHTDEETTVMAEIGRPPVLAIGHQRVEILFQRDKIKFLELFGIIEGLAHRVGKRGMGVKDLYVQMAGPPVTVRTSTRRAAVGDGTLTTVFARLGIHDDLLPVIVISWRRTGSGEIALALHCVA